MPAPRRRGRPATATTALLPAAARAPEPLTVVEATLNEQAIEVFTKAVGGRDQLAEVLSVAGTSPDVEKIALYLLDPRYAHFSLRRLCTLTGITVADLFTAYRKALIARAHITATQIIASRLPPIVEDVMTRAAPQKVICPKCLGTSAAGQGPCVLCNDTGIIQSEPDLDRQKLALELGQLVEKKGGILMQQNTIAAASLASTNSGALEQLHQAVGDLLYSPSRRRASAPVVDVEATADDSHERREPDPPWPLPVIDDPDPERGDRPPPTSDDHGEDPEAPRRR
jgi:hypothetical protein